ncbi:MAG: flavodoxin [Candidatus Margulisiibacteriota bacterium]
MKKLVVYYSLEGNTRFVAETVAKELGADLLELKPKKDVSVTSPMRFFWGGKQVVMGEKPELFPLSKEASGYDLIVIGSPVWAFTYAPAINSFLKLQPLKGKKIALFCCHESDPAKTFDNLRKTLSGNEIVGQIDFNYPLREKEGALKKIGEWVKTIKEATKNA